MVVIASPLGPWILRNRPQFVRRVIQGSSESAAWSDDGHRRVHRAAAGAGARPRQPAALPHLPAEGVRARRRAGATRRQRLTVPTKLLFGTDDFAIPKSFFDRPTEEFADDFTIEFVPDTGHFIAEERPELVNDRTLEFFARD